MKNLYLVMALLLCVAGKSQNLQNANWHFGAQAGITFLPNINSPAPITNSAMSTVESCASVSDQNGNLLFYTNGETVWNNTNTIMTNGMQLNGHISSNQIVIVPRPLHPNNYYIVTINGKTGTGMGLYYSEVSMSSIGGIVIQKNINLKDANGIYINSLYNNASEKVTSTKHRNGVDYWVVTQIEGSVYSYLVTSSGIILIPVETPAPVIIEPIYSSAIGPMKISPDTNRIAISYGVHPISGNYYCSLVTGDFNNLTGQIIFDSEQITIPNQQIFGVEFSSESSVLYFTTEGLYGTAARNTNGKFVTLSAVPAVSTHRENIKEIASMQVDQTDLTVIPTPEGAEPCGLQLAINDKIYLSIYGDSSLSVINNPNNIYFPMFESQAVNASGGVSLVLPQWVHWYTEDNMETCTPNITLSNLETHSSFNYIYSDFIKTQNQYFIPAYQDITMQAGDYILLLPDTFIALGSIYLAFIEDCTANSQIISRSGAGTGFDESEKRMFASKLTAYPNPTTGLLTISGEAITEITVVDMVGKTIFRSGYNSINSADINLSNRQGIYFVKVTKAGNVTETIKVIRN